jgi:hypothetical protein
MYVMPFKAIPKATPRKAACIRSRKAQKVVDVFTFLSMVVMAVIVIVSSAEITISIIQG